MRLSTFAAAAAMSLLAGSAAVAESPAQFVVSVYSFGFAPAPIQLAAGRPVTMVFTNRSGTGHDFTAPGFFQHAQILAGGPVTEEVELRPHETRSVTLIPARGTYQAHCSHFLHKQMGMSDTIIVN